MMPSIFIIIIIIIIIIVKNNLKTKEPFSDMKNLLLFK